MKNRTVGAGPVSAQKGITLIALVITIIIMLILAGIVLTLTIGEHGILNIAKQAGKNYQTAANHEEQQLTEFLNTSENIIAGENVTMPTIDVSVLALKAGDYIKYDTGVTTVGEEGVIICRVLYPTDSEYGLQIISDKSVKMVRLGVQGDYAKSAGSYNNAIENLNNQAEAYINNEYAYDARCVGSAPTVKDGTFVNKNKVKFEGRTEYVTPNATNYVTLHFTNASYINSLAKDINYEIDETQMKTSSIYEIEDYYWLASRSEAYSYEWNRWYFTVRYVVGVATAMDAGCMTWVGPGSDNGGRSYNMGFRPCISLKSDIIKIIDGDGKSEKTAYIIGK